MLNLPDFQQKKIICAVLNNGEKLSFKNDNLIIKDKEGQVRHQSTCYRISSLFLIGPITITSGLLQRAKKFGFSIILMSYGLRVYGGWHFGTEGNVLLRKKQYAYDSLEIAQHLVQNKIYNQLRVLKGIREKSSSIKNSIKKLEEYSQKLPQKNWNLKQVLGLEGVSSRIYFQSLFHETGWISRRPRVKHDTINTLMDTGYTFLFCFIEGLLNLYGFDVYEGVYHTNFYQRKSLVCDIVEPFRPLIDRRIYKAYRLKQVNVKDFYFSNNQYRLFGEKGKPYLKWLIEVLTKNKDELFQYVQFYYRAFMRSKPIEEYPYYDIARSTK